MTTTAVEVTGKAAAGRGADGLATAARQAYTPEYQELKFALHRKLLDRINLEILSSMAGERVRNEIRGALAKLIDEEKTPLSLVEKDRVIDEVLNEVFGLGRWSLCSRIRP